MSQKKNGNITNVIQLLYSLYSHVHSTMMPTNEEKKYLKKENTHYQSAH